MDAKYCLKMMLDSLRSGIANGTKRLHGVVQSLFIILGHKEESSLVKTLQDYLQEKARDYVNQYREVIVTRLKQEAVDVKVFLNEVCDFKEHTKDHWVDELHVQLSLYGVDVLGLEPEDYNKATNSVLAKYRRDLLPVISKDILSCITDESGSLDGDADFIESSLPEYDQTDPEDVKLYNEDKNQIAELRAFANNLRQVQAMLTIQ
jgi:hypothetical protein